jgi:membrane-bound metal-dependent hydrolase YbcI (DUF457 family)
MALCFAHATAGYLLYEAIRPVDRHRPELLAAGIALANAPDLDFVAGWLVGHPAMYHRGVSHTLAAVLVVGILAALFWWGRREPPRVAAWAGLWAAAVYGSHLLVDYFTTCVRPPHGARFLWPLSDAHLIAPFTPLREIIIDASSRAAFVLSVVHPRTFDVWLGEIGLLVAAVVAVRLVRARVASARVPTRGLTEES